MTTLPYRVSTFRQAGLEAKWSKTRRGQPYIAVRNPNASRMAEIKMTSRVLELDNQINELRQRAQAEPGNTALRLQLDVLAQEQIEALFESSREVMEHVDAALRICRKTRAEIGATQAMLARREYLESQNETDGEQ